MVFTQNAIALPPHSEPQPDLAIVAPSDDAYRGRLPSARDILLLVEVSDSTLRYDQTFKSSLYARHGIREFWIVNLLDRQVEVHRELAQGAYATQIDLAVPGVAIPEALPWMRMDLAWLLDA